MTQQQSRKGGELRYLMRCLLPLLVIKLARRGDAAPAAVPVEGALPPLLLPLLLLQARRPHQLQQLYRFRRPSRPGPFLRLPLVLLVLVVIVTKSASAFFVPCAEAREAVVRLDRTNRALRLLRMLASATAL